MWGKVSLWLTWNAEYGLEPLTELLICSPQQILATYTYIPYKDTHHAALTTIYYILQYLLWYIYNKPLTQLHMCSPQQILAAHVYRQPGLISLFFIQPSYNYG